MTKTTTTSTLPITAGICKQRFVCANFLFLFYFHIHQGQNRELIADSHSLYSRWTSHAAFCRDKVLARHLIPPRPRAHL